MSGACALRSLGKSSSKRVRAAELSGEGESTSDSTSRSTSARCVGTVRVGAPARRTAASNVSPPSSSLRTRTCCHQPEGSWKSSRRCRPGRSSSRRSAVNDSASSPVVSDDASASTACRARSCQSSMISSSAMCTARSASASRSLARWMPVSRACTLSRTSNPPGPVPMSRVERRTGVTVRGSAEAPTLRLPSADVRAAWATARARPAALSVPIGPMPATTAPGGLVHSSGSVKTWHVSRGPG